jgi:hypothetical protein
MIWTGWQKCGRSFFMEIIPENMTKAKSIRGSGFRANVCLYHTFIHCPAQPE